MPGQDRASCHALVRDPPRTRLAALIETRVYRGRYAQDVKLAPKVDRSTFTFGSVEVKPLGTNQQSQTEAPQFFSFNDEMDNAPTEPGRKADALSTTRLRA